MGFHQKQPLGQVSESPVAYVKDAPTAVGAGGGEVRSGKAVSLEKVCFQATSSQSRLKPPEKLEELVWVTTCSRAGPPWTEGAVLLPPRFPSAFGDGRSAAMQVSRERAFWGRNRCSRWKVASMS